MDYAASGARADCVDPELRRAPSRTPEPPSFSELERSVIHLSRNDPVASVPDLRGWRVAVSRLFAVNLASSLANRRLEELRRFAILVRIHDDPGDDALDRFLDAGYTVEQSELVHRIVYEGNLGQRRGLGFATWFVPLLLATGISALVQDAAGDFVFSLIVAAFVFMTFESLASPQAASTRGAADSVEPGPSRDDPALS